MIQKISRPIVCEARARNKCRVCQKAINKGEKYLSCYIMYDGLHSVPTSNGRSHYVPFPTLMKYCNGCAIELLKISEKAVHVSRRHRENVLEALGEMLSQGTRFDLLKGDAPLKEYLKEHGVNE